MLSRLVRDSCSPEGGDWRRMGLFEWEKYSREGGVRLEDLRFCSTDGVEVARSRTTQEVARALPALEFLGRIWKAILLGLLVAGSLPAVGDWVSFLDVLISVSTSVISSFTVWGPTPRLCSSCLPWCYGTILSFLRHCTLSSSQARLSFCFSSRYLSVSLSLG